MKKNIFLFLLNINLLFNLNADSDGNVIDYNSNDNAFYDHLADENYNDAYSGFGKAERAIAENTFPNANKLEKEFSLFFKIKANQNAYKGSLGEANLLISLMPCFENFNKKTFEKFKNFSKQKQSLATTLNKTNNSCLKNYNQSFFNDARRVIQENYIQEEVKKAVKKFSSAIFKKEVEIETLD